jgi:hypothetical protein
MTKEEVTSVLWDAWAIFVTCIIGVITATSAVIILRAIVSVMAPSWLQGMGDWMLDLDDWLQELNTLDPEARRALGPLAFNPAFHFGVTMYSSFVGAGCYTIGRFVKLSFSYIRDRASAGAPVSPTSAPTTE